MTTEKLVEKAEWLLASLQRSRRKAASFTAAIIHSAGSCWVFTFSGMKGFSKWAAFLFHCCHLLHPLFTTIYVPITLRRTEKLCIGTVRAGGGEGELEK